MVHSGNLIVVSGPSGTGKSTLTAAVVEQLSNIKFSISHTTRPPRAGEQDGVNYFFVTEEKFKNMIAADEFIEWATVYGNFYGTSKKFILESLNRGDDVILDIDVQGAAFVKQRFSNAVLIFILPPSYDVLRARLQSRGLDAQETIQRRLEIAKQEILRYPSYDYLIVNDQLDKAKLELKSVIIAQRCQSRVRDPLAQHILKTFN